MTPSEHLLTELQCLLDNLKQTGGLTNNSSININEHPANNNDLTILLDQLLTEANIHLSNTWAAHMTPAVSATSLLGQTIAGLHNGNLLSPQLYPILVQIEQKTISWLCQIFKQTNGHFVPSGSYANLDALWQAKQANSTHSNIVYASTAAHYSIAKACQILDLELILIPCNEQGEISSEALLKACEVTQPLAIVATLGTTALGAIDPLSDCIAIAQRFNSWCHIDASWGGALCILPEYDHLFADLAGANSVCIDPHKALSQPKPSSVLLYQHEINKIDANVSYLEEKPLAHLPGSHGGENFLPLWFMLVSKGTKVLKEQLRYRLSQAQLFAHALDQLEGCTVYPTRTGIVGFDITPEKTIDTLINRGVFSRVQISGKTIYRAVFVNNHVSAEALIAELQAYL